MYAVASDDTPKQPAKRTERRDKTNRIADISYRIAEIGPAIRGAVDGLGDKISALGNQIQADNKTADTREKEHQNRSFHWVKIGTRASIVISVFSLLSSVAALYVVNRQLDTMRIDQRAWIQIEHGIIPVVENKPLVADLIVKNTGKTPASRVEGNYRVHKIKREDSPDLKFDRIRYQGLLWNPESRRDHP